MLEFFLWEYLRFLMFPQMAPRLPISGDIFDVAKMFLSEFGNISISEIFFLRSQPKKQYYPHCKKLKF